MINDIPPKQTPSGTPLTPPAGQSEPGAFDHLPHPDGMPGQHPAALVPLREAGAYDSGSFPVLKAFQDYLETERQQARKRLVTLTVFFVALMALVVGGFIIAFIFLFGRLTHQQDANAHAQEAQQAAAQRMQETLLQVALQQRQPPPEPSPAALAAQQAARQIEAATLNLQTNLSAQMASVGATASQLDTKVDAQKEALAKLQSALTNMQQENARLRSEMPKLALEAARKIVPPAPPASVTPSTPAPAFATPSLPAADAAPAMSLTLTAGTPAATTVKPPAGYVEGILPIRGRTGDTMVPWRIFVPATNPVTH